MENYIYIKPIIHYGLHFGFPILFAYVIYRKNWVKASFLLLCTMLVDIDHLFASPIFDPNRCSIGFHILHQYHFILIYFLMIFYPKTRIVGLGLTFHMATDFIDCNMMNL